jgi:plasmid stabilization system protein ParE
VAVRTIQRSGSRFYFNEAFPDIKYPGVTSVVGMLPKPFLAFWQAKMVAELAVDSLDFIEQMAQRDRDGAVQYLKGAANRYTKTRARVGSEAHDLFERLIRGERVGRVHPDMVPYQRNFSAFLDGVQPELVRAEDVAWSDEHQYAGSFDGILRLKLDENGKPDPHGETALVMADWKTSKSTYPDVALQMSAYAHAEVIIDPAGNREPMPDFDGAVVLHITEDQAAFKPVRIDEGEVFAHFLHLRSTFEWVNKVSKTVLGDPIWSTGDALITGTQRRA